MFSDIKFQIIWQYIEYVVASLSPDENPVPNVALYNYAKECKHRTMAYF